MHGQGGGILYAPIQILFGVPFDTAVQQSLWLTILTALSAVMLFRKNRHVDWGAAIALEGGAVTGAVLSGMYVHLIPKVVLTALLGVLVFAAGAAMLMRLRGVDLPANLRRWHWKREFGGETYVINLAQGLPLAFVIGIVSSLTGAAGGFLKVPMLVCLFRMPVNVAFGSSAFMVCLTAGGGLVGHAMNGPIQWHEPLVLSLFVLVGSQIGPRLSLRAEATVARRRFAAYLFAIAGLVLASALMPVQVTKAALLLVP